MITKLMIVCLSVVSCSMIGLKLSKNLTVKVKYFDSILMLINTFISEISFRQESLKNIIENFSQNNKSFLNIHLTEFLVYLNGEVMQLNLSKGKFKPAELAAVRDFFLGLGTLDSDTQIFELKNQKLKFEEMRALAVDNHKKYNGMYLKLSFLVGLAIGIIII